jgi:hypothetical protein
MLVITPDGRFSLRYGDWVVDELQHLNRFKLTVKMDTLKLLKLTPEKKNDGLPTVFWYDSSDTALTEKIIKGFISRGEYKNLPVPYSANDVDFHLHVKRQGTDNFVLIKMDGRVYERQKDKVVEILTYNESCTITNVGSNELTVMDSSTKEKYTFTNLKDGESHKLSEYLSVVRYRNLYMPQSNDFAEMTRRYRVDLLQTIKTYGYIFGLRIHKNAMQTIRSYTLNNNVNKFS